MESASPSFPKPELTQAEWGYLAGLMDGEGSICIVKMWRGGLSESFQIIVHITNSSGVLLEYVAARLGGAIYAGRRHRGTGKLVRRWQVSGRKAVAVLEWLYPYLVAKREQARIGIEFYAVTDRKDLQQQMKELNAEGRLEPSRFQ